MNPNRNFSILGTLFALLLSVAIAQNVANYMEQGGARWVISSGGSLDVATGGELDIESGGALKIAGTAVTASAAELNAADITAAGTVTASKAVVVDSNKDIGDFRNLDAVNIDAGTATGTAGTVDVFPGTTTTGKVSLTAAASAGDYTLTLVNASLAAARTYTFPDAGEAASFVMTEGTQTINDAKTFAGTANFSGTLQVGGVAVTSSAAELNIVDGVTATAAEINEQVLTVTIADGSADATYYLVCPHAGAITKIWTVTNGAVGTADITITPNIAATPLTDGLVTIATAGSAAGDIDSSTPSAANVVTAGQAINLVVAGGGAGGSPAIQVSVVLTR